LVIDVVIGRDNHGTFGNQKNVTQDKLSSSHGSLDVNKEPNTTTTTTTPPPPPPSTYRYEKVHVQQELKHPLYDPTTLRYDIMLLQLDSPPKLFHRTDINGTATINHASFPFMRLDTGDALSAIEYNNSTTTVLPTASSRLVPSPPPTNNDTVTTTTTTTNRTILNQDSPRNDNVLLALGWGYTQTSRIGTGETADNLQQAGLGLVTNQDCLEAHEGLWITYDNRIFEEMMCTFSATRDACFGTYNIRLEHEDRCAPYV
jgi:hypothetical protein